MGTPTRTSIILDIKGSLEAITVLGGYKTTVAYVEPWLRASRDVADDERPYLGFGVEQEVIEHQCYSNMRVKASWFVVGYIASQDTWTAMSAAVNNLVDDIVVAIMADDKLGGYATQTLVTGMQTSESDPLWHEGGWCFVDFDTTYYRETTAS